MINISHRIKKWVRNQNKHRMKIGFCGCPGLCQDLNTQEEQEGGYGAPLSLTPDSLSLH
jgi:hypothetical protein